MTLAKQNFIMSWAENCLEQNPYLQMTVSISYTIRLSSVHKIYGGKPPYRRSARN